MQIRHKHILLPDQRYQDSRHLLQNPKVPKNVRHGICQKVYTGKIFKDQILPKSV